MSDIGRYRRAFPRLFRHPEFKALPPLGQRLCCYVLFGPQSNRIGLFYFSINTAAEDLDTSADSLRQALRKLTESFGWSFDASARVLYLPSWWRWNPPDHEKVLRGNLKDLAELPPCGLVDAFATNLRYLKPELHETFLKAIDIALPKATPSQDLSSIRNRNQDQKIPALRAAAEKGTPPKSNGALSEATSPIVAFARRAIELTPQGSLDEWIDSCQWLYTHETQREVKRVDVIEAINLARSEQRSTAI